MKGASNWHLLWLRLRFLSLVHCRFPLKLPQAALRHKLRKLTGARCTT